SGGQVNVAFAPGLAIYGIDADTAAVVTDESTMTDVVGYTSGIVIDPLTYAPTGHVGGPTSSLSVRRVATHLLPPGGSGYDLAHFRPTVGGVGQPAPSIGGRVYPAVTTPTGSGPLFLSGGIVESAGGAVGQRFVARAGGAAA